MVGYDEKASMRALGIVCLGFILALGGSSIAAPIVSYTVKCMDNVTGTTSVTDVNYNDLFRVYVYARDLRSAEANISFGGPFSAYCDLSFNDGTLGSWMAGAVVHNPAFNNAVNGTAGAGALIDDAGGMDGFTRTGSGIDHWLFYATFRAGTKLGTVVFSENANSVATGHETTLFDYYVNVSPSDMIYAGDFVNIVPGPVIGDANGDGVVDAADYIIVKKNFGQPVTPGDNGDFNNNGTVDYDDLQTLMGAFNSVSGVPATTPEPATLGLLALGGLALLRRKKVT